VKIGVRNSSGCGEGGRRDGCFVFVCFYCAFVVGVVGLVVVALRRSCCRFPNPIKSNI
jgi:hypothetical protein